MPKCSGSNSSSTHSSISSVFRVLGVCQHFQQVLVAPDPAAVFRRAGPFASQTQRILQSWVRREHLLKCDLVLPGVAEVILAVKLGFRGGYHLPQADPALIPHVFKSPLRITVTLLTGMELVQVRVGPTHHHLDDPVQLPECGLTADEHSPPDERTDVTQSDLQLVNLPRTGLC